MVYAETKTSVVGVVYGKQIGTIMSHPYKSAAHKNDPKWLGGVRKYADGGLVDEKGNSLSGGFEPATTYKLQDAWDKDASAKNQSDLDKAAQGTSGRSFGEHMLAGARAIFEGDKYRDAVGADRDPINPLYDRRKGK